MLNEKKKKLEEALSLRSKEIKRAQAIEASTASALSRAKERLEALKP